MSTTKKRIDGDIYRVTPFKGRKALRINYRLMKLLTPSIGALSGMLGSLKSKEIKSLGDIDIDGEAITKALDGLFDRYSEDEILDLLLMILENTERGEDGKEVFINEESFDEFFSCSLIAAFKVAVFVIQVNFPDFFSQAALIGTETKEMDG
ncbi:MAG: hypothetical protein B6241_12435 [Spirochaetaceae bacterium 4572_59]|nr:MAG: hypothetical protein B6241_12435 [Spirochaetaceae bacterium 4572_59]